MAEKELTCEGLWASQKVKPYQTSQAKTYNKFYNLSGGRNLNTQDMEAWQRKN